MKVRHLLLTAALCGLLAVPAAAAVKKGSYKGTTEQNRPVNFKVSGGKVKDFTAGMGTFCTTQGNMRMVTDAIANIPPLKISKSGSFSYTAPEDAVGVLEMVVKGKITGGKAKGTVLLSRGDSNYDASEGRIMFGQCRAEHKWTAKAR